MKKIFFLLALIIVFIGSYAQKINESEVPNFVKSSFKSKYPNVVDKVWAMADTVYNATFVMNEMTGVACVHKSGKLLFTNWEIPLIYIPAKIKTYIDTNYVGYKINKVDFVDNVTDGRYYVVEVAKKKKSCLHLSFAITNEFKKEESSICIKTKPKKINK